MRVIEANELFRAVTQTYFAGGTVLFAHQSRVQKKELPLIIITPGPAHRPLHPAETQIDGETVQSYPSRISYTVDLFTHGSPVVVTAEDAEATGIPEGTVTGYENTAMNDMLSYMSFLNSQYVIDWCSVNDAAILADDDPQDLTAAINDTNYEFRSRLTVQFYFTQEAIGYAGTLRETSIKYPDGTGGWTSVRPVETESPTNGYVTEAMLRERQAKVVPESETTSSGGGSEELASRDAGYFTEAEIKEEETE